LTAPPPAAAIRDVTLLAGIFGAQVLSVAVLATAEFCAEPIEGDVGDPQFCRITANREISTPYFSIVVEAGFLVGVHDQGRKLQVQSSIRQSMDVLTVWKLERAPPPDLSKCPKLTETIEDNVTWRDCRMTEQGIHHRQLVAILKNGHVLIEYSYGPLGTPSAPALERMTQSIRIIAS
jgi:hypothetical protein